MEMTVYSLSAQRALSTGPCPSLFLLQEDWSEGLGEEAGLLPGGESSMTGSFLHRHKEASFKESLEV